MLTLDDLRKLHNSSNESLAYEVVSRGDPLPDCMRLTCRADEEPPAGRETFFAMGFWGPREWLYSEFREGQPLAYSEFLNGSDVHLLLIYNVWPAKRPLDAQWYVEVGGRLIRLGLQRSVPLCSSIEGGAHAHGNYRSSVASIGHDLAAAYCSIVGGMNIVSQIPGGMEAQGLPRSVIDWRSAYVCILSGRYGIVDWTNVSKAKARTMVRKELAHLETQFEFLRNGDEDQLMSGLRCFLDTRLDTDSPSAPCDFILVQTPENDADIKRDRVGNPLLYRVKDHDWENLQVIVEPSKAIDAYVAHTLRNLDDRFDFDPFCRS